MGIASEYWDKHLDRSFIEELSPDEISTNIPRQVYNAHFSYVSPKLTRNPELILANRSWPIGLG